MKNRNHKTRDVDFNGVIYDVTYTQEDNRIWIYDAKEIFNPFTGEDVATYEDGELWGYLTEHLENHYYEYSTEANSLWVS